MKRIKLARAVGMFAGLVLLSDLIHAAPRMPYPPWPQATLSIHGWDGASLYWSGGPIAIGESYAAFADCWSGYSLVRDGLSAVPVTIPVGTARAKLKSLPAPGRFAYGIPQTGRARTRNWAATVRAIILRCWNW